MDTLNYLLEKFDLLGWNGRCPIELHAFSRRDMARLFAKLGFKLGVEVGVEEGRFSQTLCVENPDLRLFSVDPWVTNGDYKAHMTQDQMEVLYVKAQHRLEPYNCTILRRTSLNAISYFENESLDFVYLDGDHEFRHLADDLYEWSRKVRVGGIISGHDYRRPKDSKDPYIHVVQVLHGWTDAYRIRPWFVFGAEVEKELGDHARSWMWVKS